METPTAYKIYTERFISVANNGKLLKDHARKILTWRFRIPPEKVMNVLSEMQKLELIMMNGNQHIEILLKSNVQPRRNQSFKNPLQ